MSHDAPKGEVIMEFVTIGKSVKVTAFDPVSMKEATVIGSAKATRKELTQLAIRKLEYVLNKGNRDS